MRGKYRRHIALLLTLLLCVSGLGGCGRQKTEEDDDVTLWVVTEQSCSDGMNLQAQMIAQRMEEAYDNLTVQLDILPTDAQERDIYLTQLRTQIMAGGGPDVYLLPTGDVLTTDYATVSIAERETIQIQVTPLFPDVAQAMRTGVFADIQEYYDADQALGKETLKTEVMDAGTVGESRYVLPLRFDIPVLFTNREAWDEYGLDQELLDSGAAGLVETLLAQENGALASAGVQLPNDLSLLPQPFDYEKEEVLVTAQEIADYMRLYQAWKAASIPAAQSLLDFETERALMIEDEDWRQMFTIVFTMDSCNDLLRYILYDLHWSKAGLPLYTSALADTLQTVGITELREIAEGTEPELPMFPLRAAGGKVTASVAYFGAVGSGCENPELAYEFLRQFLTEEFQWDIARPQANKDAPLTAVREPQNRGQVEDSWPVRTEGSVSYLWDTVQYQLKNRSNSFWEISNFLARQLQILELTDADLPALSWELDEVRFPVILDESESMEYALSLLNEEDGTPTDVDIDALAEEVRLNLWWHLAEG